MKVHAIIQARMGSTRLPGKVLMGLGGDSVLARVVRRCQRARQLDGVVVATSTRSEDEAIVQECARLGVEAFRGPDEDVLERYAGAVRRLASGVVARVTADCPLIDPELIDAMVARYREWDAAGERCDYLSNSIERSFPRGLDVEIVRANALLAAAEEARAPHEREHVTPFIYLRPERYALRAWTSPLDASEHRWTLDTAEDLELLRRIFDRLGAAADKAGWREVLELVRAEPDWARINRHVVQKDLQERSKPR